MYIQIILSVVYKPTLCRQKRRTSYISLQYLLSLLLVLQGVDREVRDSDRSWGCESDQQHQAPLSLLQRHLQLVGLLFAQGWQVNLAPRNKHSPSACGFLQAKQEHSALLVFSWAQKKHQFPTCGSVYVQLQPTPLVEFCLIFKSCEL